MFRKMQSLNIFNHFRIFDTVATTKDTATSSTNCIKLIVGNQLFMKSKAISALMVEAHWYFQPLRIFFLLPSGFLDAMYDFIAKNRYLWGKEDNCEVI